MTDQKLATVLMQVASEMYVSEMLKSQSESSSYHPFKLGVAFYTNNSENIVSLKPGALAMDIPDKCPVLWIGDGEVDITSDCQQKHLAFLVCGQGHYYPMAPKHASKFDACHFDADALDYSVDHCIAITDDDQSCEPVHVNNMGDLETIHAYLDSRTQKTANDIRPYAAYFRIERFNPRLLVNQHYSVLLRGGDKGDRCTYIDVQGKRVLYDRCNVPHRNLCLVESATNGQRGNQTTMTTSTTTMATETKA
ncbi:MAG: hypothetical protein ABW185_21460, partial [Sedimenticola sp.]